MSIFNQLNNTLESYGFKRNLVKSIDSLGVILYEHEHINVLVKHYNIAPEPKHIGDEAIELRERLLMQDMNAWNAYYLICIDNEVEFDDVYIIERNTRGLRKYVIREIFDLDRIPFLNTHSQLREKSDKNKNGDEKEIPPIVEEIERQIKQNNGIEERLDNKTIEEIASQIINRVKNDENK
ncbi:ABC-three component system middle component 1 [Bacillus sp. FDAARGOS_235]|uniref:ABC-three component system middle component 1 n=1 Tax=Bacillus sp. FDAARGOS_235 TaxID=1839798 RepID=UPI0011AAA2F5|nr:ABC-three component system middle component 1 [Bacillus sp. FDAARGOS_235]